MLLNDNRSFWKNLKMRLIVKFRRRLRSSEMCRRRRIRRSSNSKLKLRRKFGRM